MFRSAERNCELGSCNFSCGGKKNIPDHSCPRNKYLKELSCGSFPEFSLRVERTKYPHQPLGHVRIKSYHIVCMADQRAIDYINQQRGFNFADKNIRSNAISGGFTEQEIDEAFAALSASQGTPSHVHVAPEAQPVPAVSVTANQQEPVKIGKFKASWMITKESWGFLKQDKEVMWFPVISAIVTIIAIAAMVLVYLIFIIAGDPDNVSPDTVAGPFIRYGTLFVYYLIIIFIANYFKAGILIVVSARFRGESLEFGDGIGGATRNSGKLFVWALISATVGVVLNFLENRAKIFGTIAAFIFGAAWGILTYFSLPALVVGGSSIVGSFKESAAAIRKTWGETIIVNFGMGLFMSLLMIGSIILATILTVFFHSLAAVLAIWGLWIVFFISLIIVSATLGIIFKLALYEYAKNGTIPAGFSPELIRGAIRKR
jgi:hypothetical protein